MLEHFVAVGQQTMRCGYTTGTCAAAAALAAAKALLNGEFPAQVTIDTPAGIAVTVEIVDLELTADHAACAVKKDGGDDIDATSGAKIRAVVSRIPAGIEIDGGDGVGRVTKAGLDQPVGAAAINSVPRRMIEERSKRRFPATKAAFAPSSRCPTARRSRKRPSIPAWASRAVSPFWAPPALSAP